MNRTSKTLDPGKPGSMPLRRKEYVPICILILFGLTGLFYVRQSMVADTNSRSNSILFARLVKNDSAASKVVSPAEVDHETVEQSIPSITTEAAAQAGDLTRIQVHHLPEIGQHLIIDFGDGDSAPVNANQISHRYQQAGAYNIRILTRQAERWTEIARTQVEVSPAMMVTSGE